MLYSASSHFQLPKYRRQLIGEIPLDEASVSRHSISTLSICFEITPLVWRLVLVTRLLNSGVHYPVEAIGSRADIISERSEIDF